MTDSDLGPQPEPVIEPGEPHPGGVDSIDGASRTDAHDLPPENNPAVEDALPDEMKEAEDTHTQATKDDGEDVDPEEESPA
jgi:hypothetical protein